MAEYAWLVSEVNSRGNAADRGVFMSLDLLGVTLKAKGYVRDHDDLDSPNDAAWLRPPRSLEVRRTNAPDSGVEVYARCFEIDAWVDGWFE